MLVADVFIIVCVGVRGCRWEYICVCTLIYFCICLFFLIFFFRIMVKSKYSGDFVDPTDHTRYLLQIHLQLFSPLSHNTVH